MLVLTTIFDINSLLYRLTRTAIETGSGATIYTVPLVLMQFLTNL